MTALTRTDNAIRRMGGQYTYETIVSSTVDSLHGEDSETVFSTSTIYAIIYPFSVEAQYLNEGFEQSQMIRCFVATTETITRGDLITYGGRKFRVGPIQLFDDHIRFEAKEV